MISFKSRGFGVPACMLGLLVAGIATYLFWPERLPSAPVLDTLDASVERGQYLATIGNCKTCHTVEGRPPFTGGVRFETEFGTLYSTNITAHPSRGIGGWSFEDFYHSMKRGIRPDGTRLYPAFPYPSFAKLTDQDIASIYLYVKTIAPAEAPVRENDLGFPYNMRVGLRGWNKLFHEPEAYVDDRSKSAEWNRGAYLVQGIAHCGACHTPRNLLGAEDNDRLLTGGTLFDTVSRGKYRQWWAINLTPSNEGLGAWSTTDIVSYLKQGECDRAVVHGPMTEVVVNATRYLKDVDARAIAHYLQELPATSDRSVSRPSDAQLAAGEVAYTVHCGTCHLPTGLGDEVMGVTLAGNAIVQSPDPSSLINVVLYGPRLPPPPFVSDRTRMKPFGKRLSDEDIANLTTYVRANFGNKAGPVTVKQVQRQR